MQLYPVERHTQKKTHKRHVEKFSKREKRAANWCSRKDYENANRASALANS